jgi:hypothetical protein
MSSPWMAETGALFEIVSCLSSKFRKEIRICSSRTRDEVSGPEEARSTHDLEGSSYGSLHL